MARDTTTKMAKEAAKNYRFDNAQELDAFIAGYTKGCSDAILQVIRNNAIIENGRKGA